MKKIIALIGILGLVGSVVGMDSSGDLVVAVQDNDFSYVNRLIKDGVDLNRIGGDYLDTPLTMAVKFGNKEIVETLIKAGADLDVKNMLDHSALTVAVNVGDKEIVEALIKAGADLDVKDGHGDTALDWAKKLND
ncbi:MAG TPA: ankyrin repeat domain-containing protein [Candidatus Babeliales bacterium]|nr:ankyrin repeat domain-containing protein [Candidatus Babeliales bacterium]